MRLRNDNTGEILGCDVPKGRKRPAIYFERGGKRDYYATLPDGIQAERFMERLSDFIGTNASEGKE